MSENSKGYTVKIGADTTEFIKGLRKMDKEINATSRQVNTLQKGLELEFDDKRFAHSQKLAQEALEKTEEKVVLIRKQLKYLEQTGGVNTDGYKKLTNELYKAQNNAILLKQKLEDVNNVKTGGIAGKIKNLVVGLKASTVAIAAVVAGTYKIASTASQAAGAIQDIADRLGITAEQAQRYNYIAMQSGVETDQLVKSMAKARDAIGTAMAGVSNTATKALEALFGDLNNLPSSTEAGFEAIINQLAKMEDSTMQAYYANEIFGERLATNLIPLINNGADKIAQLNSEFSALGSLTNEEVQELADFDDLINNITTRVKNLVYNLGLGLAPVIKLLFELLEPFVELLNVILEVLNPIIEGISWLFRLINDAAFAFIGKGWLWGEPSEILQPGKKETYNETNFNYDLPKNTQTNNSSTKYEDNSTMNIEINADLKGNLEYDAEALANSVIKRIAVAKQSSGRF